MLPPCNTVADIGCDHGKLALQIIHSGKAQKVIATDISAPSLNKARELFHAHSLDACAEFRRGDGLSVINPGEIQAAIIAGMGGHLIAQMLEKPFDDECVFVLQPMQHSTALRSSLRESGYRILDELTAKEDRRVYETMLVCRGSCAYPKDMPPEHFDEVGPALWKKRDPLAFEKLIRKKEALISKIAELSKCGTDSAKASIEAKKAKCVIISEIIDSWNGGV